MRLDEFFDLTLIVNLPDRADRRRETVAELKRQGVEAPSDRVRFFPATRPDDAGGFPTLGAHGCFLSHLAALRQARDGGAKRLLVLEDDVHPLPALKTAGETLIPQLADRSWDMAILGWTRHSDDSLATADSPHWKATDEQFIGTHAYAVNGPALDKVIALLERALRDDEPHHPDGRRYHIDELYWIYGQNGDVEQLMALPTLFGQRSSRSDVMGEAPWADRLPVVRTLMGLARRVRNKLRE